ncbi:palmitoyltransferase ZDHHC15-like [Galendromus occidentalis]|uniref:Palmitoyltransferase n=1 Tax=Galendromus occidentalis TaxID=34638 RepID=A0AAJ6QY23_9ACAR|nr:palmitoyltransferase ZDHHC15-like [Galendromus occidentalis]
MAAIPPESPKSDSQGGPFWDIVGRYIGLLVFFILVKTSCSLYLYSVVFSAVGPTHRNLQYFLTTFTYFFGILSVWSYWRTHRELPSKIPDRYYFTGAEWRIIEALRYDHQALSEELAVMADARGIRTRTPDGLVNACNTCRVIKPERTHHCSVCRMCVIKMDHHCPWFGNCIHYHNFKYFLQALLYSTLGMTFMLLTAAIYLLVSDNGMKRMKAADGAVLGFVVLVLLSFCVGVPTGGFFVASFYHAMHNVTTLEDLKGTVYFADGAEESYNLGSCCLNLKQQLGPVFLAWLIPVNSTPGDGTQYLVRSDVDTAKSKRRKLTDKKAIDHTFSGTTS